MTTSTASISLFATLALCFSAAHAQIGLPKEPAQVIASGPSLEDTGKWLAEKMGSYSYTEDDPTVRHKYSANFAGCEMTIVQTMMVNRRPPDGSFDFSTIYTTELSYLDPDKLSIVRWRGEVTKIYLYTWGDKSVTVDAKDGTHNAAVTRAVQGRQVKYFELHFLERELAERVSNALKHSIRSCIRQAGAKKAAEPPRPKEIF